jgi:signal transduction histidine kinase
MIPAPIPANEQQRIAALARYDILDSLPEDEFDDITRLASYICRTPISVMTLVDSQRLWVKSGVGIAAGTQSSRDEAFCAHTILEHDGLVVNDLLEDARFVGNPLVRLAPNIRFYVGMRLVTPDGYAVGSLCAMDSVPRQLSSDQIAALKTLAKQVVKNMELRSALARVSELAEGLARMNAGKDRMFNLVAHDLKSPFSGLLGMLELMSESVDDMSKDEIQRHLQMLYHSAADTFSLLERLLQWSTFESGEILFRPATLPIDDLLNDVVGLLQGIAARKSICLTAISNPGAAVLADHAMIHSVIQNLVGNALKFTGKNGSITLSSRSLDNWVEIEVADTGVGMSQQMLDSILNRASGNTTSGTDGETGTGLGLNLSQGFVDKHGGKFSATSEVGKGTTFRFTLPLAPA